MYILQQRYFLVYLPTLSNQDCPTDPVHISGVLFWRRTSCVFVLFAVNVARCRATFIPALVIVLSQMSSSAWFELFLIFDCLLWKTIVKWQTICLKCQRSCLLFYQIKSKFFTQWESFWTGILQAEWRLCLLMYDKKWKQVCESRSKSVYFHVYNETFSGTHAALFNSHVHFTALLPPQTAGLHAFTQNRKSEPLKVWCEGVHSDPEISMSLSASSVLCRVREWLDERPRWIQTGEDHICIQSPQMTSNSSVWVI